MSDLIASSLNVTFGIRPLFEGVSVTVDPGDRIALVGPNGAGKTTLLRVLSGAMQPTSGTVIVPDHLHVSLHDQRPERSKTALRDYAAPAHMVKLEARLRELELAMATGDEAVMSEWEKVRATYDAAGGEAWTVTVETILRGLGFIDRQLDQPLDTLSGGELTRASLAKALSGAPDVLLLDEPTNHLDMDAIDWLTEYIGNMRGGVVMVSHDRWFIEELCTSVIEISNGRGRRFSGSFVEYRTQQAMEAVTFQRHVEHWKVEVARLQRFVDRFAAGTRSKQAQSRVKALDRLREDTPAYNDLSTRNVLDFKLPSPAPCSRTVLDVRGIELGFPDTDGSDRLLLHPTDFVIEKGEKIALLGRNGTGKSTLLHALAAACIPLEKPPGAHRGGEIRVGYGTQARLLSQHDSELVDNQSMLGNMNLAAPDISRRQAISLLALFGFRGDESERLVGTLSGGERRRVLLAMALTGSANLLLLDEPTNHLDIESREALEAAISEFQGTVILISHDRALIEGMATRTLVLHDETLVTAPGGYDHARRILANEEEPTRVFAQQQKLQSSTNKPGKQKSAHKAAPKVASTGGASKPAAAAAATAPGAAGSEKRTVRRSDGRDGVTSNAKGKQQRVKRLRRPATIEMEIEQLEKRHGEVQQQMLDPEIYTSPEKSATVLEEHSTLERDIANRYEELESALEFHGS